MKLSRNRIAAIACTGVLGLVLQGCGEPTNSANRPDVHSSPIPEASATPLEFDGRIPEALRAAFAENGWGPGQYLDLGDPVEAESGTHYTEICDITPADGESWSIRTLPGGLSPSGQFLYSYAFDSEDATGDMTSGPHGDWQAQVFVEADCAEVAFIKHELNGSANWLGDLPAEYAGIHLFYAWSAGKFITSDHGHEFDGYWAIYSFDPATETGALAHSNQDLENALAFMGYEDANYLNFNDRMGVVTFANAEGYTEGLPKYDEENLELVWFDAAGSEKPAWLGYGNLAAASADGVFVVENFADSSTQALKFLSNSTQAPNLAKLESLFTLSRNSGYELVSLSASGESVVGALRDHTTDVLSGLAVFNFANYTVDFIEVPDDARAPIQSGVDYVAWSVGTPTGPITATVQHRFSTQTLVKYPDRVQLQGDFILTPSALLQAVN